jgi:hypothetical protein
MDGRRASEIDKFPACFTDTRTRFDNDSFWLAGMYNPAVSELYIPLEIQITQRGNTLTT